ncbi:hypothetical protein EUGRSUZ_I02397, partial [Eucalyptus grandis]
PETPFETSRSPPPRFHVFPRDAAALDAARLMTSPVLSEILLLHFMVNSALRRRTHLVQSFSVVFLYWFYVFS